MAVGVGLEVGEVPKGTGEERTCEAIVSCGLNSYLMVCFRKWRQKIMANSNFILI